MKLMSFFCDMCCKISTPASINCETLIMYLERGRETIMMISPAKYMNERVFLVSIF
jgi:hypothetical protein